LRRPTVGRFFLWPEQLREDLPIPGAPFTFGRLEAAQAEGDLVALRARGRPAIRIEDPGLLER
jgi:glucose-6-phosphate isomerase